MENKEIIIKGARENNLKNVDLTIPRDKLVVFTGVSVVVSHLWLLIQFMQKVREDMWKVFLLMPECF